MNLVAMNSNESGVRASEGRASFIRTMCHGDNSRTTPLRPGRLLVSGVHWPDQHNPDGFVLWAYSVAAEPTGLPAPPHTDGNAYPPSDPGELESAMESGPTDFERTKPRKIVVQCTAFALSVSGKSA